MKFGVTCLCDECPKQKCTVCSNVFVNSSLNTLHHPLAVNAFSLWGCQQKVWL